MPPSLQRSDIQPYQSALIDHRLHEYAVVSEPNWPMLRKELHRAGAAWIAVRATGAYDRCRRTHLPTHWHVFTAVRCPTGHPWRALSAAQAAQKLGLWLYLRRPDEIEVSDSIVTLQVKAG